MISGLLDEYREMEKCRWATLILFIILASPGVLNFLRDLHSDSHIQFAQLTASRDFLFASRSRDFFISEGVNPVIFLN
jgi:hypothetical protein